VADLDSLSGCRRRSSENQEKETGKSLISRICTADDNGEPETYESLLRAEVLPGIHRIMATTGLSVCDLRQATTEIEFVTITQFTDIVAVRAFAGKDYGRAVIEPGA